LDLAQTALTATVVTFFGGVLAALAWSPIGGGGAASWTRPACCRWRCRRPWWDWLLLLVCGRSSPVGAALSHLGLMVIFSWPAAALAATVVAFPIMYLTIRAGFQQIDATLLDVARLDGLSEWRILWQVMVPLAWPALAAAWR